MYLVTFAALSVRRRYCDAQCHAVTLSRCMCVRRISLGGKGNALYPMLSSLELRHLHTDLTWYNKIVFDIVHVNSDVFFTHDPNIC